MRPMSTGSFDYSIYEERLNRRMFKELPELLHAYTYARDIEQTRGDGSAIAGDIDMPDQPSVGMRSYLRIASRHPGQAARLVSELKILIERGPEDEIVDELIDAGIADPARLRPSDDVLPDEFFQRMLPHLQAFIDAGDQVDDNVPETSWEWRHRFDELSHLFGGFYMYWQDDYADHDAVIDGKIGGQPDPEVVANTLAQLEELRSFCADEKSLEVALRRLGFNGYPPQRMPYSDWFSHIERRLRRYHAAPRSGK